VHDFNRWESVKAEDTSVNQVPAGIQFILLAAVILKGEFKAKNYIA